MQIYLFGFGKKQNSTAQPTLSSGNTVQAQLKEPTNVTNPVLIFNKANAYGQPEQMTIYNYIYIPLFLRYYFVTDWKYINGAWEAYCHVDVLASFKSSIGNTSAYVERSASHSDGTLSDGLYPIKASASIIVTDFGTVYDLNTGCFVVGVIDCTSTLYRKGSVTYWAMTENELNNLLQFLFSGSIYNMSNITEIGEGLYKSIMNPAQYIVSAMWVPIARDTIASGTATYVAIGYWTTTVSSKVMNSINLSKETIKTIPSHPQSTRGAYMNYSPFARYTLYYPPFGAVPIDSIYRTQGDYLVAKTFLDLISGQGSLRVSVQSGDTSIAESYQRVCAERSAMVGVPIQISQVNTDTFNGVSGLVNSAISALSGNYAGALSGVMASVGDLTQTRANSIGYNGSFLECFMSHKLVSEFYYQADADNTDHGKPLMQTKTISTLSGYIKCADGHFAGACYESERAEINSYMINGFYYE